MAEVTDLAEHIYANTIDLERPIFWIDTAKKAYQAAEVFLKYSKDNKIPYNAKLHALVDNELMNGHLINAVKEVRAATGLGLKESKDVITSYKVTGHWILPG